MSSNQIVDNSSDTICFVCNGERKVYEFDVDGGIQIAPITDSVEIHIAGNDWHYNNKRIVSCPECCQ